MNAFFSFAPRSLSAPTLLLSSLLILAAGIVPARADGLKSAQVTRIYNDVKLLPDGGAPRPAVVADSVSGKAAVQTGTGSRTELLFTDRTLTRLGANTYFSFENGTRNMDLGSGTMLLQVPKGAGGAQIRTAAVTAAITGTTLLVEYNPKSYSKIIVLEGTVRVFLKGKAGESILVHAGEMIISPPNATRLAEPVAVDLKLLYATSGLLDNKRFGALPSEKLVGNEVATQQKDIKAGKLAGSNLFIVGRGTSVQVGSLSYVSTQDHRITSQQKRDSVLDPDNPEGSRSNITSPRQPTPIQPTPTPVQPTPTPVQPTPTPVQPTPTPSTPTPPPTAPPISPTPTPVATPTPQPSSSPVATPTVPPTPSPTPVATPSPQPSPSPVTPTPPPVTPTPPPVTPTPPPVTPTPPPVTPTPPPVTPTPPPVTPTPPPVTPTPPPTPNKFGPLPIIPGNASAGTTPANLYIIDDTTTIRTDPFITTQDVTGEGRIYRGSTGGDGAPASYFFAGQSPSAFDNAINFNGEFDTGLQYGAFKFDFLSLAAGPAISTTDGPVRLALISIGGILGSPTSPTTFDLTGVRKTLLATQNGFISLGQNLTFANTAGTSSLTIYARGASSTLNVGAALNVNGDIALYSENSMNFNASGRALGFDTFTAVSGTDLRLNGRINGVDDESLLTGSAAASLTVGAGADLFADTISLSSGSDFLQVGGAVTTERLTLGSTGGAVSTTSNAVVDAGTITIVHPAGLSLDGQVTFNVALQSADSLNRGDITLGGTIRGFDSGVSGPVGSVAFSTQQGNIAVNGTLSADQINLNTDGGNYSTGSAAAISASLLYVTTPNGTISLTAEHYVPLADESTSFLNFTGNKIQITTTDFLPAIGLAFNLTQTGAFTVPAESSYKFNSLTLVNSTTTSDFGSLTLGVSSQLNSPSIMAGGSLSVLGNATLTTFQAGFGGDAGFGEDAVLNSSNNFNVGGNFTAGAGASITANNLMVGGNVTFAGATYSSAGLLSVGGNLDVQAGSSVSLFQQANVNGTLTLAGPGSLTLGGIINVTNAGNAADGLAITGTPVVTIAAPVFQDLVPAITVAQGNFNAGGATINGASGAGTNFYQFNGVLAVPNGSFSTTGDVTVNSLTVGGDIAIGGNLKANNVTTTGASPAITVNNLAVANLTTQGTLQVNGNLYPDDFNRASVITADRISADSVAFDQTALFGFLPLPAVITGGKGGSLTLTLASPLYVGPGSINAVPPPRPAGTNVLPANAYSNLNAATADGVGYAQGDFGGLRGDAGQLAFVVNNNANDAGSFTLGDFTDQFLPAFLTADGGSYTTATTSATAGLAGAGGTISIRTGGDINLSRTSTISAAGGNFLARNSVGGGDTGAAGYGGTVLLDSAGSLGIDGDAVINVTGGSVGAMIPSRPGGKAGPSPSFTSFVPLLTGDGGSVNLQAAGPISLGVQSEGPVTANLYAQGGANAADGQAGGNGGLVSIVSLSAATTMPAIHLIAQVDAATGASGSGLAYSGTGGTITLLANDGTAATPTGSPGPAHLLIEDSALVASDDGTTTLAGSGSHARNGGGISVSTARVGGPGIAVDDSSLVALIAPSSPGKGGSIRLTTGGADVSITDTQILTNSGTSASAADRSLLAIDTVNPVNSSVVSIGSSTLMADDLRIRATGTNGGIVINANSTLNAATQLRLYATGANSSITFNGGNITLNTGTLAAGILAAPTITISNGTTVTVNGSIPLQVYTTTANYSNDYGGNNSTTGLFAGTAAPFAPQPLANAPAYPAAAPGGRPATPLPATPATLTAVPVGPAASAGLKTNSPKATVVGRLAGGQFVLAPANRASVPFNALNPRDLSFDPKAATARGPATPAGTVRANVPRATVAGSLLPPAARGAAARNTAAGQQAARFDRGSVKVPPGVTRNQR